MTEIDELVGVKLAQAVMVARGGVPMKGYRSAVYMLNGTEVIVFSDELTTFFSKVELDYHNRPDLNIAQAWDLVAEMTSTIENSKDGCACFLRVGVVQEMPATTIHRVVVGRGKTASEAICRAFLKAKAEQR